MFFCNFFPIAVKSYLNKITKVPPISPARATRNQRGNNFTGVSIQFLYAHGDAQKTHYKSIKTKVIYISAFVAKTWRQLLTYRSR